MLREGFVGLVASSPSSPSSEIGFHLPGEVRIRRDDAALVVEVDDLAAYGEALVLGRLAVFVIEDRRDRHAVTLAATVRSSRDALRVARRQCTERFPCGVSDRAS